MTTHEPTTLARGHLAERMPRTLRVFALIGLALLALLPGAAHAQDAASRIAEWTESALLDLQRSPRCFEGVRPPYAVAFYGLPQGTPQVTEGDRRRLNDLVRDGLRAAEEPLDVSQAASLGALAPALQTGGTAAVGRALEALSTSAVAVTLRVARPAPDVARLEVLLFARGSDGGYPCNRALTVPLRLSDLAPVTDPRTGEDLVTPAAAHRVLVEALAGHVDGIPALRLRVEGPDCPLATRLEEAFRNAYARAELPPVLTDARADAPLVAVTHRPHAGGTLDVGLTLVADGQERLRRTVAAAADAAFARACAAPPPCGRIAALDLAPPRTAPGAKLTLSARVQACEPQFFVLAGKTLTPLPLSVFDARTTTDGTLYQVSPTTAQSLVVLETDPIGRHQVGLFCACDGLDLPGWLRALGPAEVAAAPTGRGRLPTGEAYAWESFERVR